MSQMRSILLGRRGVACAVPFGAHEVGRRRMDPFADDIESSDRLGGTIAWTHSLKGETMNDDTKHGGGSTQDIAFPSADGSSTIHARIWWPAGAMPGQDTDPENKDGGQGPSPRGVVQIVHGMCEHVRRYDDFARFLCSQGWIVCGDDHIGHGRSANPEKRGCMPAKGGDAVLVEDEHALRAIMQDKVGEDIPYAFFGHSMGSFITRVYLAEHGGGLAAAIICGTGTIPVAKSRAGHALARVVATLRGEDHVSKLLDSLGSGGYDKQLAATGGGSWLSYNEKNVAAYHADAECGFIFSAGGYCALTALTARACSRSCAACVPHDLPLLYIGGDGDPVGDMGSGVEAAAQLARDAGSADVTCKIYSHMRHEILNEEENSLVFADVARWLDEKASR